MPPSRVPRDAVAAATDASTPEHTESVAVTVSDIARRVFELYLAPGRQDGHDVNDGCKRSASFKGRGPASE
jgi:hypothetical protein